MQPSVLVAVECTENFKMRASQITSYSARHLTSTPARLQEGRSQLTQAWEVPTAFTLLLKPISGVCGAKLLTDFHKAQHMPWTVNVVLASLVRIIPPENSTILILCQNWSTAIVLCSTTEAAASVEAALPSSNPRLHVSQGTRMLGGEGTLFSILCKRSALSGRCSPGEPADTPLQPCHQPRRAPPWPFTTWVPIVVPETTW